MGFEKLEAWQFAKKFVIDVYGITNVFPKKERFGLISQINRAAISVASNIAEGNGRRSEKEKIHFIEISYGSLMEVACQLNISYELGYIEKESLNKVKKDIIILTKMLSKLRATFIAS